MTRSAGGGVGGDLFVGRPAAARVTQNCSENAGSSDELSQQALSVYRIRMSRVAELCVQSSLAAACPACIVQGHSRT